MKMKSNLFAIAHMSNYKREMVLDAYQTSDAEHEELWWQFCMLGLYAVIFR